MITPICFQNSCLVGLQTSIYLVKNGSQWSPLSMLVEDSRRTCDSEGLVGFIRFQVINVEVSQYIPTAI